MWIPEGSAHLAGCIICTNCISLWAVGESQTHVRPQTEKPHTPFTPHDSRIFLLWFLWTGPGRIHTEPKFMTELKLSHEAIESYARDVSFAACFMLLFWLAFIYTRTELICIPFAIATSIHIMELLYHVSCIILYAFGVINVRRNYISRVVQPFKRKRLNHSISGLSRVNDRIREEVAVCCGGSTIKKVHYMTSTHISIERIVNLA